MTGVVAWFVLAGLVGWLGIIVWRSGPKALRSTLHVLAWIELVAVTLFVLYLLERGDLTAGGLAIAAVVWLVCGVVLVRRLRARRGGEDGDTPTPS